VRWKEAQKPGRSAIIEGTRAVSRFIELYGERHVASITVNEIFDFRDFLQAMPRGLSLPAIQSSGKTLRATVAEAHEKERDEEGRALAAGRVPSAPKRLAPTSIKKDIGGLSAIFAALRSERWILQNPAEKIPVDGYSKGKKVYPFRPDMMKRLFESPMFTGCEGLRPKKRRQAGPYVFQDTLYWSFLFAASVGHRMSEVAVALTENVEEAIGPKGEKIVGIFIMDAKNEFSQRVIIVHPELLSLGFMDHVQERRRAGKANLFDLPGGGARKLSEKLNAYIDAVVVDDRRFVFHSMRHEFADRSEIDVGVELSKKIMGHARGRLYGLGAPLHHAAAELNKIDMSFVEWERLRAAACASAGAAEAA
jgi:integrase